jgi:hypothetical protein
MAGPRIGDPVHYTSYGTPGGEYATACRAAVITGLGDPIDYPAGEELGPEDAQLVDLCVLNPTGMFFNTGVPQDERPGYERSGGTWHWPETE